MFHLGEGKGTKSDGVHINNELWAAFLRWGDQSLLNWQEVTSVVRIEIVDLSIMQI